MSRLQFEDGEAFGGIGHGQGAIMTGPSEFGAIRRETDRMNPTSTLFWRGQSDNNILEHSLWSEGGRDCGREVETKV